MARNKQPETKQQQRIDVNYYSQSQSKTLLAQDILLTVEIGARIESRFYYKYGLHFLLDDCLIS